MSEFIQTEQKHAGHFNEQVRIYGENDSASVSGSDVRETLIAPADTVDGHGSPVSDLTLPSLARWLATKLSGQSFTK